MTPKQQAIDLVEKYEKYLYDKFTMDEEWVKCVECALVAVNEILAVTSESYDIDHINWWKEVKKEIEKL